MAGEFAIGFGDPGAHPRVALVGGNLSRGPLTMTVQLTGQVPAGDGTAPQRGASGR